MWSDPILSHCKICGPRFGKPWSRLNTTCWCCYFCIQHTFCSLKSCRSHFYSHVYILHQICHQKYLSYHEDFRFVNLNALSCKKHFPCFSELKDVHFWFYSFCFFCSFWGSFFDPRQSVSWFFFYSPLPHQSSWKVFYAD